MEISHHHKYIEVTTTSFKILKAIVLHYPLGFIDAAKNLWNLGIFSTFLIAYPKYPTTKSVKHACFSYVGCCLWVIAIAITINIMPKTIFFNPIQVRGEIG